MASCKKFTNGPELSVTGDYEIHFIEQPVQHENYSTPGVSIKLFVSAAETTGPRLQSTEKFEFFEDLRVFTS